MFAPLVAEKESRTAPAAKPQRSRANPVTLLDKDLRARPGSGPHPAGATRFVQASLTVGAVNDPLEHDADAVARQVLHMPDGAASRGAANGVAPARRAQTAAPGRESYEDPLPSSGQPLDPATRAFFEPRFGHDFSQVRIYSDTEAAESAKSLGARAYTAGSKIAFGGGLYQPGTGEGQRLLAHELTHVVQQGHAAAVPGGGVAVAKGATPAIQRDTPPGPAGQTAPTGPLTITKKFTPDKDVVSRQEATQALTDFLWKAQAAQGGQTLRVTPAVRAAVLKLFKGDTNGSISAESFLNRTVLPGSPPEFAAAVAQLLPEQVPRSRIAFLDTQAPQDAPDTAPKSVGEAAGHAVVDSTVAPLVKKLGLPKSWQEKIVEGARSAVADGMVAIVDQAMSGSPMNATDKNAIHSAVEAAIKQRTGASPDRKQDGAGSPYAPVQPPSSAPSLGSAQAPGEHIFNLPKIPWDFPTQKLPKPNIPQAPLASEAQAVDKIIQSLDDASLIPAAAKGKPDAGEYASAKELARSIANLLAAADKKKQYSVDLTIGANYRHVEDLADIFDKIEAIVKQVANALPGGAANVGEVIISPARSGKGDTFPARRIVKLHGGG
jgi:hypothetical protein